MNQYDDRTLPWPGGPRLPLPPPPEPPAPPPRKKRGRLFRIARWTLAVLAAYYAFAVVLLVVYRFVPPPTTGVQVQRRLEAVLSGEEYEKKQTWRDADEISRHAGRAVVSAEDQRFWNHGGFDWVEMKRARDEAGEEGGRLRGASTITQQLVKNLFGCACRNPIRKLYDLTLTPPAELILGKRRILELYLNEVEWGPGVFGIEAGARHHYGTGAKRLTRTQAAGLAALLPNPRQRTPANTGWYRREILRRMGRSGW